MVQPSELFIASFTKLPHLHITNNHTYLLSHTLHTTTVTFCHKFISSCYENTELKTRNANPHHKDRTKTARAALHPPRRVEGNDALASTPSSLRFCISDFSFEDLLYQGHGGRAPGRARYLPRDTFASS